MSDEKTAKSGSTADTDKELSELLDSALGDFSKEPEKDSAETKAEGKKDEAAEEATGEGQEWSEEFIREAAQQFESNISRLLGDSDGNPLTPEQIQQSFQRMAEAAQQVLVNPGEVTDTSGDISSTITQTLQSLSQGAENLQNPFSEQDLLNMFGTGGGATEGAEQNGFLPFMQGMMQSLLSKEVLYPSLKDILEKYPDWLRENAATLTSEDKQRYENQQKLMEDVCKELETENEADIADVKKERFEKVLSLMQKLQDYGQPPAELVGDVGPGFQFDAQGNPDQCNLM